MNADEVRKYGASLRKIRLGDDSWLEPIPQDIEDADKIIILIHGFTSHGSVLEDLGIGLGLFIKPALILTYNYDSFIGIDKAAEILDGLLNRLNMLTKELVQKRPLYLIAHSMGGLVARYFTMHAKAGTWVRGIAMLGTPNKGTLCNSMFNKKLIDCMIDYGEHITGSVYSRNPLGLSAKQLTKTDGNEKKSFIDQLNEDWTDFHESPPTLTISGGFPKLEVAEKNNAKNVLFNKYVQNLIFKHKTNDGLVLDESVNMDAHISKTAKHEYLHLNGYPEYSNINHTYLVKNSTLRLELIGWIQRLEGNLTWFY